VAPAARVPGVRNEGGPLRRFMYYKFIFSLVMLLFLGEYLRQGKHLFGLVGGVIKQAYVWVATI
jgi:hypothetical protein